jgi:hypothetical protein
LASAADPAAGMGVAGTKIVSNSPQPTKCFIALLVKKFVFSRLVTKSHILGNSGFVTHLGRLAVVAAMGWFFFPLTTAEFSPEAWNHASQQVKYIRLAAAIAGIFSAGQLPSGLPMPLYGYVAAIK